MGTMENKNSVERLTWALYILFGLGIVSGGFLALVGLVIAHVKVSDIGDMVCASHFRYLIRTAWICIVLSAVGFVLAFVLVGFPILILTWIWTVYRLIKGALRLNEGRSI